MFDKYTLMYLFAFESVELFVIKRFFVGNCLYDGENLA